jgi:para-nitrobenzyl esterase
MLVTEVSHALRSNIAAFGGDPHNVTVFGQSASSDIVANLLIMREARGLIQRGIMESAP